MHLEYALHLGKRLIRLGYPRSDSLGAVDGGAPSESYDGLAVALKINYSCLLHVVGGGICNCPVIHIASYAVGLEILLKPFCYAKIPDALIRYKKRPFYSFFSEKTRDRIYALKYFRLSVRKNGDSDSEYRLKRAAIRFSYYVHCSCKFFAGFRL